MKVHRALLVTTMLSVGCGSSTPSPSPSPPSTTSSSAAPLDTVVVAAASGATVQVPGRVVVAAAHVVVAAPVAARVRRLLVAPGDAVKRGAPVVEVIMPAVVEAVAALDGALARRAPVLARRGHLDALRAEGIADVAAELDVAATLAELEATIASARATLRIADLDDGALDAVRGGGVVALRVPVAGVVATIDAVVGAVVDAGAPLATFVASIDDDDRARRRVVVRTAIAIDDEALTKAGTATLMGADGTTIGLRALAAVDSIGVRDGARDRWFVVDDAAAGAAARAALVDGRVVTVALPAQGTARVPASAVRLGSDGVAVVVDAATLQSCTVTVVGRLDDDVLVDGLAVGATIARDVRLALVRGEREQVR